MPDRITVYQKPTCTTCREVYKILTEAGVDMEAVDYYVEPLSERKIRELLGKLRMSPRELLRVREEVYGKLGLADGGHTDDEIVRLMSKHPDLIQRPIVVRGDRAILARPPEKIREIL